MGKPPNAVNAKIICSDAVGDIYADNSHALQLMDLELASRKVLTMNDWAKDNSARLEGGAKPSAPILESGTSVVSLGVVRLGYILRMPSDRPKLLV